MTDTDFVRGRAPHLTYPCEFDREGRTQLLADDLVMVNLKR
jgi:hypothetical protein